uniref:Retrotransposon gag domain-containing protein n=1 Tax=Ananas comosus var. bracteatus TaxID=296719 RepID=A0A6V7PL00_ANACO|nr:unnamed protein product [Ananas comosus var. bracteatus]
METLFDDLRTLERDKVYLATHCLEKAAKVWWKHVKRDRLPGLPPMLWEEFKREMFANYFPDTLKRKLKEKFHKLEQGDRLVAEYEQEFSHIIDCVPDLAKDDRTGPSGSYEDFGRDLQGRADSQAHNLCGSIRLSAMGGAWRRPRSGEAWAFGRVQG